MFNYRPADESAASEVEKIQGCWPRDILACTIASLVAVVDLAFSIIGVSYFSALRNAYNYYNIIMALHYYTVTMSPRVSRLLNLLLFMQQDEV